MSSRRIPASLIMSRNAYSAIFAGVYRFLIIASLSFGLLPGCGTRESESAYVSDATFRERLSLLGGAKGLRFFRLPGPEEWTDLPADSLNPITPAKVRLGQALFFDPAISFDPACKAAARTFSCASCHFAAAGFQAGIRQSIAGGGRGHGFLRHKHPSCDSSEVDVQMLRTPSIAHCAWQEVQLWSGKLGGTGPNQGTDSLWPAGSFLELNKLGLQGVETQARVALEAHGMRMSSDLLTQTKYKELFDEAFPTEKDELRYRRFSMARAIAAWERTVVCDLAPWQVWLRGDSSALSKRQKEGAAIFFGKAKCVQCHTGPALNSMSFHVLGMSDMEGPGIIPKPGSQDHKLGRGAFTGKSEDRYAFKTPQLYNLKDAGFLGHGGNFCSVEEVIRYKNAGKAQNDAVPKEQISVHFRPLNLNEKEIQALTDFLENALYDPRLKRYEPESVPSGFCFPNADKLSRAQLGCR